MKSPFVSSTLRHPAGVALSLAFLSACSYFGTSPPKDQDFINAAAPLASGGATFCVLSADYSNRNSSMGGLQRRAWAVDAPGSTEGRFGRTNQGSTAKYQTLVQAGILADEPLQVWVNGVEVAAHRYYATPLGQKSFNQAGNACLMVGEWHPTGLAAIVSADDPSAKPITVTKKTVGDQVTFEATVKIELQNMPDWAGNAAFADSYQEANALSEKNALVELKKGPQGWEVVHVALLPGAHDRNIGTNTNAQKIDPVPPIPAALEPKALSALADTFNQGFNRFGRSNVLSLAFNQADHNYGTYGGSNPLGTVFIGSEPDKDRFTRERDQKLAAQAQMRINLERVRAADPARLATYRQQQALESRNAAITEDTNSAAYQQKVDSYLNGRRELQEILDALVTAGAYTKQPILKGDRPEMYSDGFLYSPASGVAATVSGLELPRIKMVGPLVQTTAKSGALLISAQTEYVSPPDWIAKAIAAKPMLAWLLTPAPAFATVTAGPPSEFPYHLQASSGAGSVVY